MALKRCVTSEELAAIKAKEKEISNLVKGGAASKANLTQIAEKQTEVNTQIEQVKVEAKKKYVEYTLTGFLPIALPSKSYKTINTAEIWDDKKKKWTSPWFGPTIFIQREQTITGAGLSVYLEKYGTYRRRILNGLATVESNGVSTPTGDNDWPYVVDADGDPTLKIRWTILIEDENVEKDLQEEVDKLIKAKENHPTFNTLAAEIEADFAEYVPEITATIAKLREEYGIPVPPVQTAPTSAAAYSDIGANPNIEGLSNALDSISAIAAIASNPGAAIAGIAANAFANTVGGVIGNITGSANANIQDPQNLLTGTVGDIVGGITGGLAGAASGVLPGAGDLIAGIQADNPSSFVSSIPISELDICKAIPKKKITKTPTGEKIAEDLPPQPKEPTAEQSQQPSIKQEETIVKTKEQPVETVKPEAAVVDPVTEEVKPITRSLDKIEEDIIAVNKLIISKFVNSLTGPFGNISLELPKQYPNFEAKNLLSSKKMRQFYKDEFRSKEQYKVMKSKLKEYRNADEGIKRGISILNTQHVREYGLDAGLSQDDLDFYERFISANLEDERIGFEILFYYRIIGHYISVLADDPGRGVIAVFGDIKMPENKIFDTGYELQNPTKFIGTPTEPYLGNDGLNLRSGVWRETPEGMSESFLKNYFEYKKTHAWIFTDTYGPPETVTTMSSIRAANFFGILIPEAMLIVQQHHDLYRELKAATDLQTFDILPSTSKWYDIANS